MRGARPWRPDAAVSGEADAHVADLDAGQQAGERRSVSRRADQIICCLACLLLIGNSSGANLITCIVCVTGQSRGPFNRKANAAFPSLPVGTGWLPVENRRAPVVIPATNIASSIKIIVEVGGGGGRCHRVCMSRNSQSRWSMSHPSTQPSRSSKHGSDSRRFHGMSQELA